jgi:hypothetical protein
LGGLVTFWAWLRTGKGYANFWEFWDQFAPWGLVRVIFAAFYGWLAGCWAVLILTLLLHGCSRAIGLILTPFYLFVGDQRRETKWPSVAGKVIYGSLLAAFGCAIVAGVGCFGAALFHGESWSLRFFDWWWEGFRTLLKQLLHIG